MDYPENIIKGIPNNDFLVKDGTNKNVHSHLFEFKQREDGSVEQSINWEDDESVIDFTLNQKKANGDLQFKEGVVILSRAEVDKLNRRPTIGGVLSYERSPLDGNPYHGNLLLQANVPKPIMKQIAAHLAVLISDRTMQRSKNKTF